MRQSYKHWMIRGLLRERIDWTMDGEPFPEIPGDRELAVVIFDSARGWKIEATLNEEREAVVSLRVDDTSGIAQRKLQGLPLGFIRDAARSYMKRYESFLSDGGISPDQAIALANRNPGEVEISPALPSLNEFAQEWQSIAEADIYDGERLTRREYLAKRYDRTVWWVDKRTKEARERGLLPKPTTGRGHKMPPQTPGGKPAR